MSNFFEEVAADATAVEEELLGPDYAYYDYINSPSEMGMSSTGSFSAVATNIGGLINYTQLLVSGGGGASKTGDALGPQFFLETGQKCTAVDTGEMATRYIYINHKPTGNIPFISSALGENFTEFEGLIPGTLENLNDLNPMTIFSAFSSDTNPECQELQMETTPTDINNYQTKQTEYVTINDISALDSCLFTLNKNKNPVTGEKCNEAFQNLNSTKNNISHDKLVQLFYGSLGIVGLYLLFKFMAKNKNI